MCYACKYKNFPHWRLILQATGMIFYFDDFHLHIVFEHLYNKERRNVKLKKYFRPAATHIFCHSRLFLNFAKVWPVRCAAHD